jgi:tRNA dimethylallyltransferase
LTGKPYSQQRADWFHSAPKHNPDRGGTGIATESPLFIGLTLSSADLHQRINARVEKMFANGLVAETEELLKRGLAENRTAMQALGYRQVVEHLRGLRSLKETIELVKIRTRQFAKRQITWFKKYGPTNWINLSNLDTLDSGANEIIRHLRRENSDCANVST